MGVVLGSNLFNLAALLGLSALVAGGVRIRRGPLVLDAAVGLFVIAAAAAMLAGVVAPAVALVFVAPVFAAYAVALALPRGRLRRLRAIARGVPATLHEVAVDTTHDHPVATHGSWLPVMLLPAALAGVVGGSFLMVRQALAAQTFLHVSSAVLGIIVLAALTSLPNLWVALHFARRDQGTALFSSAMNSNTINLLGGLLVPALVVGTASAKGSLSYFTWLIGLTLLAVLAPLPRSRLSRIAGGVIIAIYLAFVALRATGV